MDMALANQAIEAYIPIISDNGQERLRFFAGLWQIQQELVEKAKAAYDYKMPASEQLLTWYWDEKPLLMMQPLKIDKDLLLEALRRCSAYIIEGGVMAEPVTALLKNFDWEALIDEVGLEQCGYDPVYWIVTAAQAAARQADAKASPESDALDDTGVLGIVISYAVRPMLEPIASKALALYKPDRERYESHIKPLRCPVCGGGATLAHVGTTPSSDGVGRMLYCTACGANWEFERIRCAHCGTQNQSKLHYFHVEDDTAHRLYLCDECGGYIRTSFLAELKAPFCMDVEDVVMARLDYVAKHVHMKHRRQQ